MSSNCSIKRALFMNGNTLGKLALVVVSIIAVLTACAHMSCIVLGENCFRAQMAPEIIVKSAVDGTWLAPIGTTLVSGLFLTCAVYALSAAKYIKHVPFTKAAIYAIAGLCLLRGAATLPLSIIHFDKMTTFAYIAGIIWFISGVLFVAGYLLLNTNTKTRN